MLECGGLYIPLVVVGPSGVGKGTIIKNLFLLHPSLFSFSISHTTRIPRPDEINGVHYYFVNKDEFDTIKESGGFLESVEFCDNYYGTSIVEMNRLRSNKLVPILEIDMAGYVQLLNKDINVRSIFILPPSLEELRRRLLSRGADIEETINKRLGIAKSEIEMSKEIFFDHIVVNSCVENTVSEIDKHIKDWYKEEISKI